jgi:hemerythrin-like domain-containing protein
MHDPMTILKADHREAKQLMTALAGTDEGSERDTLATELDEALSLHMSIEETLVYPLVAKYVGAEDEEEAEIEHGLAREGLAKVMSMRDVPGFGAAVEMLKGGITHHVEEEESELLPSLRDAVSREQWLELGDAIAKAKADAGVPLPAANGKKSSKRKPAAKK